MEIRLTKDYRGKETKEIFYLKGSVVAMTDAGAARLLEMGFAEPVGDNDERLAYPGLEDGSGQRPPDLVPMPEADAIVAADNAKIIENLKAEQQAQQDAIRAEQAVKETNDKPFEPVVYESPDDDETFMHTQKSKRRK